MRDLYGDTDLTPIDIRGGSESGTSERLAHFILQDLGRREALNPKLLYLTGDKNRDILPNILEGGGVEVDCRQVYETQPCTDLAVKLQDVVDASDAGESANIIWRYNRGHSLPSDKAVKLFTAHIHVNRWWIVFFAPSAAAAALPSLRAWFDIDSSFASKQLRSARLAAIGPTTATSMRDEMQVRVDVVSAKPTPSDMVDAVLAYDRGKVQGQA
jgi:uroporphyrinogen-III synthase